MDRAGVGNVARQMRYFDAHVEQALALVLDFLVFRLLALESPDLVHDALDKFLSLSYN